MTNDLKYCIILYEGGSNMSKKKFSWDLFTDVNENIVMKDTKDNEMIFLQMAEE